MAVEIEVGTRTLSVSDCVFLDANFIIDIRVEQEQDTVLHNRARVLFKQLLKAATEGQVSLYISSMVMNEVWYKLAYVLHESSGSEGSWRDKTTRTQTYRRHRNELQETTSLLCTNPLIRIPEIGEDDITTALEYVLDDETSLDPFDAFHAAVMSRLSIGNIVSRDCDFDRLDFCTTLNYSESEDYA